MKQNTATSQQKPDTLPAAKFQNYTGINVRNAYSETLTRKGLGVLIIPCHKSNNQLPKYQKHNNSRV